MRWRAARAPPSKQGTSASKRKPHYATVGQCRLRCARQYVGSRRCGSRSPAADLSSGRVMPPHVSNSCRCGGGFFGLVFAGRTNAARAFALVGLCVSRRISRRCDYLCPAPVVCVSAPSGWFHVWATVAAGWYMCVCVWCFLCACGRRCIASQFAQVGPSTTSPGLVQGFGPSVCGPSLRRNA